MCLIRLESRSNPARIPLESRSNPARIPLEPGSKHKRSRALSRAFTSFTVHEIHHPSGTFTSPIWNIVETNRQYYSIAFERFELGSNASSRFRDIFKPIQRDISFDTVFDTGRNGSNPFETFECNGVILSIGFHYVPDGR